MKLAFHVVFCGLHKDFEKFRKVKETLYIIFYNEHPRKVGFAISPLSNSFKTFCGHVINVKF